MQKATAERTVDDRSLALLLENYKGLAGNHISKTARLYEACLRLIEKGHWAPGDRLPSEALLTEHMPVGLATVQAAFRRLVADGLVVRKRKLGSFIAQPAGEQAEDLDLFFIDEDGKGVLSFADLDVAVEQITDRGPWTRFLGTQPRYLKIRRVSDIGGRFLTVSNTYIAHPKVQELARTAPDELRNVSFRWFLHQRFGLPSVRSERVVGFAHLDAETAAALQRPANSTALLLQTREFSMRDAPLFYSEMIVPENGTGLCVSGNRRLLDARQSEEPQWCRRD
ncbi:GntR family transcriptional regulator [Rhodobium gokarnense]|uniref:DNA-binding GntR family transcriptional regulator n=1 Tax=Rhodobium gokarnense TaxID=364296 RepID=A0ABT3HBN4_9HYPH|nr:GntR family transcriptional regulator [Rhodobium gokarnense]MCW2307813.1 DNA-binding GntR family transcriptional regulator [Rhodobium gokarnense]